MPNEKFVTLRRLGLDEMVRDGDFYKSTDGPDAEEAYREVSPIPEGYEVCDLADATKVLIGETWFEKVGIIIQRAGSRHYFTEEALAPLGVLAIRPIPEPEPMRGEGVVTEGVVQAYVGGLPFELIGKTIRWEEVVKDGGE